MKVKELVKQLSTFDPESEVTYVEYHNVFPSVSFEDVEEVHEIVTHQDKKVCYKQVILGPAGVREDWFNLED